MSRKNRNRISCLLLFVLGLLLLKNSFLVEKNFQFCDEFAHIHWTELTSSSPQSLSASTSSNTADSECRSGKMTSHDSMTPDIFAKESARFDLVFELVGRIDNEIQDPHIEPRKKPPRSI